MLKAKLGNEVLLWIQTNGDLDSSEHQNQLKFVVSACLISRAVKRTLHFHLVCK